MRIINMGDDGTYNESSQILTIRGSKYANYRGLINPNWILIDPALKNVIVNGNLYCTKLDSVEYKFTDGTIEIQEASNEN